MSAGDEVQVFRYDPTPMSEAEAARAALFQRVRDEGGLLIDSDGRVIGRVLPARGSFAEFDICAPVEPA